MKLHQTVPSLPVPDVREAQEYYRDTLGFEIGWHHGEGRIGAVSHGECAIFFRESAEVGPGASFWIYTEDVDDAWETFWQAGAEIVEKLTDMPWGLRQFSIRDPWGNVFHIHHDL